MRALLFLIFSALVTTFSSTAEPITMTCSSVFDQTATINLTIDSSGQLLAIETPGSLSWSYNPNVDDATTTRNPFAVLNHTGLMTELTKLANPNNIPAAGAFLSIIASKWTENSSLEEKLEIISDDSAGLIFLEFWDTNGAVIGNALSWGWAGNFKNCH